MNLTPEQFFGGSQTPNPSTLTPNAPAPTGTMNPTPNEQPSTGIPAGQFFSGQGTPNSQPPSVGGFVGNALGSVGNLVGGVANAVMHPIDTVSNLGNVAMGGITEGVNALTGETTQNSQTQSFDTLKNFYNERYGISDLLTGNVQGALGKMAKTFYTDPAGAAADISMLFDGGGALLSKLGDAGEAGNIISKAGEAASKVGEVANPFAASEKLISTASRPIADYITKMPESLYNSALGVTKQMIVKGRSPSEFLADQGVWGTAKSIYDQVQEGMNNANEIINAKLAATPGTIQTADVILQAKDFIANKFKGAYTPEEIDSAFAKLPIADLVNNKELPFAQANAMRQTLDKIIGSRYFISDATPAISKDALNSVSRTLSNTIKESTDTGAEFNALSKYIQTNKLLESKFAQSSRMAGKIPFKDIMGAGAGGMLGGIPGAMIGAGINELGESSIAKTGIAQAIKRTNELGSKISNSLPVRVATNPRVLNVVSRANSLSSAADSGKNQSNPKRQILIRRQSKQ